MSHLKWDMWERGMKMRGECDILRVASSWQFWKKWCWAIRRGY